MSKLRHERGENHRPDRVFCAKLVDKEPGRPIFSVTINCWSKAPGARLCYVREGGLPNGMQPSWNEADRLAALRSYGILDSATETAFEDFVRIAAEICGAPIAVVNLIDATRQWFAAEIGLGVRETPVDVSICAHAILQQDVFIVPDLAQDARFRANPLVAGDPRLRFYGGALLETADGLPLGTMCVLDYTPRPAGLTDSQVFTLKALARQVMAQLELRRLLVEKEALIAEKDLLVLEAHHRVTNSLAMVQSLLRLQARTTTDPEAAEKLRESAGRILTIGAMHEHLYRIGAALDVDLALYLRNLLDDQKAALASTLEGRDIVFDAPATSWPSTDAPAVGLIIMELVTNALKYGEGTITVTLAPSDGGVALTVEDEGQGLPPGYEISQSNGLGMRVLTGLLGRRGTIDVDRTRGHTCFAVTMRAATP